MKDFFGKTAVQIFTAIFLSTLFVTALFTLFVHGLSLISACVFALLIVAAEIVGLMVFVLLRRIVNDDAGDL